MHLVYPVVIAALLFSVGVYGVLARRNAILVLMSVELMLNAVNLNLVLFDMRWARPAARRAGAHAVRHRAGGGRGRAGPRPGPAGLPQPPHRRRRPAAHTLRPRSRTRRRRGAPVIVLAAVAVLLPFAAAFVGMIFGPTLSLLLSPLARRLRRAPRGLVVREGTRAGPAPARERPGPHRGAADRGLRRAHRRDRGRRVAAAATSVPARSRSCGPAACRSASRSTSTGSSAVVAFMVCCVALAVQIYSVAYMRDDPRYSSYAAFVSLFTAAMLLVVLSGDLLVLYVGWEVMGVCSYFLIGHYWHDRATSRAAVKAFLVTRLGDVGFLFGIFVLGMGAHSFQIRTVLAHVHVDAALHAHRRHAAAALRRRGQERAVPAAHLAARRDGRPDPGQRADPRRDDGRGRHLRRRPALPGVPARPGLARGARRDRRRSPCSAPRWPRSPRTTSNGCWPTPRSASSRTWPAASRSAPATARVFHLLAHGAFKALLFLGAGCVIVAVGSNMLSAMGGLRHAMPVTFWSMTVGFAALAGIPPASGFFSKDAILAQAWHTASHAGRASRPWTGWLVLVAGLLTAAVTAAYATRTWLVAFFGERPVAGPRRARRRALMRWPVAVLAVPALLLGFLGARHATACGLEPGMAVVSLLFVRPSARAASTSSWNRDPALDPVRLLGPARPFLRGRRSASTTCTPRVFVRPGRGARPAGRTRRPAASWTPPSRAPAAARGGSAACCARPRTATRRRTSPGSWRE